MADLTAVSWSEWPAHARPEDQVSPHFRFYELTASELAQRRGIPNAFETVAHVRAAVHVCRNVLEPLRAAFGPFSPNSVYRSQALERALKGKPASWTSDSQHCLGQACDVEIAGKPTIELAKWAAQNLEFDQVICECYDPALGPNAGWVHISLRPPGAERNRREILSYVRDARSGKYVYVAGLEPTTA